MATSANRYWDVHECAWKQHQPQGRPDDAPPAEPARLPEPREEASAVSAPAAEASARV
jgi:hypothetical protein